MIEGGKERKRSTEGGIMGACVLCDKLPVVFILPDSREKRRDRTPDPVDLHQSKTGLRLLPLNSSGMSVHLSCLCFYFSKVGLNC